MDLLYDSAQQPPHDRVEAWREVTGRLSAPTELTVGPPDDFRATLRAMPLGDVALSHLTYSSHGSRRTPRLIRRSDPELYGLVLVRGGRIGVVQAGREAALGPHDLALYSTSTPFEALTDTGRGTGGLLAVHVSRTLLPMAPAQLDRLLASPLPGRDPLGALLADFLTRVASGAAGFRAADRPRLGMVLLDLLNATLAHHLDGVRRVPPECHRRVLLLRIQAFIGQRLDDPLLSPGTVAAAHHISTRYLHLLFQRQGHTVAEWIRRQRLERVRADLTDPAQAGRSIGEIAGRWGFPHPAAFTRTFRAAYGLAPRDYRRQAAEPGCVPRQGAVRARPTTP